MSIKDFLPGSDARRIRMMREEYESSEEYKEAEPLTDSDQRIAEELWTDPEAEKPLTLKERAKAEAKESLMLPGPLYGDTEGVSDKAKIMAAVKQKPQDQLFALAWTELEEGTFDKGLWARLYQENEGDEKKTKVAYLSARVEQLKSG